MRKQSTITRLDLFRVRGFGLVELMVGVVIGMLGIIVVMQVFSVAEEQRRSTATGADAQSNGLISVFTIERDVRMAGLGTSALGCTTINTYDDTSTPKQGTMSGLPITISQNSPTGTTNDEIQVFYSTSSYSAVPGIVQGNHPTSSAVTPVDMALGYKSGDYVVLSEPGKDCSLLQLTQDGQATGQANNTGPGTRWKLNHNSGNSNYNPPNSTNLFPTGGYNEGAKAFNLGALIHRAYYVQNNSLMVRDLRAPAGTNNPLALVTDIFALHAAYGRDTDNDGDVDNWDNSTPSNPAEVIAVRLAIVARSGQYEKEQVSPATLTLWENGPTITLRTDSEADLNNRDRHYRYKTYQTTIPLRNIIWSKA